MSGIRYHDTGMGLVQEITTCERCDERGWYCQVKPGTEDDPIPDYDEIYCTCPAGQRKYAAEGGEVRYVAVTAPAGS